MGAPRPSHLGMWDRTNPNHSPVILSESSQSEDESKDLRLLFNELWLHRTGVARSKSPQPGLLSGHEFTRAAIAAI